MSPVALTSPSYFGVSPSLGQGLKCDPSRRPSPWTDLAHSLSESILPPTPRSTSTTTTTPAATGPSPSPIPSRGSPTPDSTLSSSALREWDRLLLESSGNAKRHHLIHPPPQAQLAAERDKDGHIEYKLKLIDPTPDRFERLVTQMLWRLKQGRNEAIYEIGLADDGTVIGLTRAEMDASLHTLEQMAAEVGATVLILKEIVLCSSSVLPRHSSTFGETETGTSPGLSSISPSALSLSSDVDAGGWMVPRPDLDAAGQPRKGTRSISHGSAGCPWRDGKVGKRGMGKVMVFDQAELGNGGSEDGSPFSPLDSDGGKGDNGEGDGDDDIPPFHLDLDIDLEVNLVPAPNPSPHAHPRDPSDPNALKSAKRREARRLELYKGDGTNPLWTEQIISHPHQPARPSTLRLATPAYPASSSSSSSALASPADPDPFLVDLLHVPLDNLSLSFADVRTVTDASSPASSVSDDDGNDGRDGDDGDDGDEGDEGDDSAESLTECATSPPLPTGALGNTIHPATVSGVIGQLGPTIIMPRPGFERICVEALVVRKTAEGVAGVTEWCEDGDDAWGFGADGDGEEGEVDPDDGWGLEG
ncbi:uncharacterized protein MKK02DRAFT_22016 [Dioszegia hungarica]|uniref:Uncharacterized protein n=1 Tax=Dioszegia hungarica TaxID=4972 RepID=A0AA38HF23_9TREE|nr:uncharacterized protein MKK02DRAFT_22016 [Dioszegia hungarica]KAI9638737.1 hypothetical protein MKK02DRAFT_22016 [Dioszegia hungarica]